MNLDWLDKLAAQDPIIDQISLPGWHERGLQLLIKRDDLLHPHISGNKFYKLKHNLFQAAAGGHNSLLSFGGAHSNHLFALAAAGALSGVQTIGVVRGERPKHLSQTLLFCQNQGMILHFVSRTEYRLKTQSDFINQLNKIYGCFYLIPEGGTNLAALSGTSQILAKIHLPYSVVALACGTGGTIAGLAATLPKGKKLIGIPVLKNAEFLYKDINLLLQSWASSQPKPCQTAPYTLLTQFAGPGYAKSLPEHIAFKSWFEQQSNIPLDQVYNIKLFYGLHQLAMQDYFGPQTSILAIHTGGYQASNYSEYE